MENRCIITFMSDSEDDIWQHLDEHSWRRRLTPEQFEVCRRGSTEAAFSGRYWDCQRPGMYACSCCEQALFNSRAKFDSGTGWPSFYEPVGDAVVIRIEDMSHGMIRTEIRCGRCDAHLGHVFPDGPPPTGLRYCINSISLKLYEDSGAQA